MTKKELQSDLEWRELYARQATAPEWFELAQKEGYITACATSGTSPFNEWYAFKDRAQAIRMIDMQFNSQTLVDNFVKIGDEYYDYDQIDPKSMETADDAEDFALIEGAKPADLQSMVWAESRF